MADYIGGRPKKKGTGLKQFVFVIFIILVVGGAYTYFVYLWPHSIQQKAVDQLTRVEEMVQRGCKGDDTRCQTRLSKAINEAKENIFDQTLKDALTTAEIKKHLKMAHTDDSICFLVDEDQGTSPSDEKLVLWLGGYGSQKFLDDRFLITRARQMYEARYLKPTPDLYQLNLLRKLRWRHLPFGETWRNYTLAARFLEWSALVSGITQPAEATPEERRITKAMKKNPIYFTDKNIARLTALSKRELTLGRLEKIKTAIRRFRSDVRELPLNENKTRLALGWLASKDDLHPWLKRRWHGPYVTKTEIIDLWECPIVGVRVPKTGAMTLISYGGDCNEGGAAESEDIALSVSAYTPPPKKKVAKKRKTRRLRRKKRRPSLLLP